MSALTDRLLAPGVALMRRLRLAVKLTGIAAAILLPLLGLALTDFDRSRQDLAIVRAESAGAQVAQAIADLAAAVQRHRDLTQRVLAGDGASMAARDASAGTLSDAARALDVAVAEHPALGLEAR